MTEAYPLKWPEGWPRTPAQDRADGAKFKVGNPYQNDASLPSGRRYVGMKPVSFERARSLLSDEMDRLGATNVVLSTNVPTRLDGLPRAGAAGRRMDDPGAAIYFTLRKKQMVMAQDAYTDIAANIRSLGLAVEAMRQLERHGGGTMMERAFSGFAAIAPPDWKKPWREVFGWKPDYRPSLDEVRQQFRVLAQRRHPDNGGADTLMAELNLAYEEAKREIAP